MKFLLFALVIAAIVWATRGVLPSGQTMSATDAGKLLDVPLDATADTINAAHRRLIAKVHPDAGGSAELAARVNQARDVLLRRLAR